MFPRLLYSFLQVYTKGNFFVIRLRVTYVDMHQLLATKMDDEESASVCVFDFFDRCMQCVGAERSVDNALTRLIASRLQTQLPIRMTEVLESKGFNCDIAVKTKADQAEYFFEIIRPVEQNTEELAILTSTVMKEGTLDKLSPSFGVGMQSRYFVLLSGVSKAPELIYYEKKEDYMQRLKSKGKISCAGIQGVQLKADKGKFNLSIQMDEHHNNRTYELYTNSQDEAKEWEIQISEAVRKAFSA